MRLHLWQRGKPLFMALALVLGLCAPASAQAPADFEDSIAQRVKACTACHGDQGRAGPDGYYPRLAGKPAGYLYNQLLNFRDGRRHYGPMTHMVNLLSDAYLQEIAGYFASLDVPYPEPPASPTRITQALLERGRTLALHGDADAGLPACIACHGDKLTGVQPRFPGLLGLPVDYLTAQLGAWQSGERKAQDPDCMARIRQRLSGADAYAVVNWLARQPVPADAHPAPEGATTQPVAPDLACGTAPPLVSGVRP